MGEIGDRPSLGYAQLNVAQCPRAQGGFEDGLEASWEAVMVYREVEDKHAECTALLLTCNLYLQSRRFQEMQEPANDALFIAQDQGLTDLEKNAQEYLDQIQQMMVQSQQQ